MAEYIERDEAIATLNKVRDDQRFFKYATASDFLSARYAIERAAKVLESLPAADVEPVQEWISVKDRLPENGVHVLLCCEIHRCDGEIAGKYVCDGYYAEANKLIAREDEYSKEDDEYYLCEGWYEVIKNWDAYTSVPVEDFVTHWMPLPEPPKGGNT